MNPSMFRTNISKKYCYINDIMHTIYYAPVHFKDFIHKVNGYIETSYDEVDNIYHMTINIRNNKNKDCYV